MKNLNGDLLGRLKSPTYGTTLTFRKDGGIQSANISKVHQNNLINAYQRLKLPNLAEVYRAGKKPLQLAFEDSKLSLYADMIRLNATRETEAIGLTREMKKRHRCVAYPYIISGGSLAPISMDEDGKTDINLGDLTISTATTVADLSEAIVTNNPGFLYGDRITFVAFVQRLLLNQPLIDCEWSTITLREDSTTLLNALVNMDHFCSKDGVLGIKTSYTGCYTYIHSRRDAETNELLLSEQRLFNNNQEVIERFTQPEVLARAAETYGYSIESSAVLDPNSESYINAAQKFGIAITEGGNSLSKT